jgi:hypothetical protein
MDAVFAIWFSAEKGAAIWFSAEKGWTILVLWTKRLGVSVEVDSTRAAGIGLVRKKADGYASRHARRLARALLITDV